MFTSVHYLIIVVLPSDFLSCQTHHAFSTSSPIATMLQVKHVQGFEKNKITVEAVSWCHSVMTSWRGGWRHDVEGGEGGFTDVASSNKPKPVTNTRGIPLVETERFSVQWATLTRQFKCHSFALVEVVSAGGHEFCVVQSTDRMLEVVYQR